GPLFFSGGDPPVPPGVRSLALAHLRCGLGGSVRPRGVFVLFGGAGRSGAEPSVRAGPRSRAHARGPPSGRSYSAVISKPSALYTLTLASVEVSRNAGTPSASAAARPGSITARPRPRPCADGRTPTVPRNQAGPWGR